jgi:hypothetical protein
MSHPPHRLAGRYLRLFGLTLLLGVIAAAVGFFPTRRLAGEPGVAAMLAGCGVAVLAGWIGGAVACRQGGRGPEQINRLLAATALRLFAAVGLALAVALSGLVVLKPFLLWVALAYLVTLAGETALLATWSRHTESPGGVASDGPFADGGAHSDIDKTLLDQRDASDT